MERSHRNNGEDHFAQPIDSQPRSRVGVTISLEKMNKRLRQRNNMGVTQISTPAVLAPLSQRSFSPPAYQQMQQMETAQQNNLRASQQMRVVGQGNIPQSLQNEQEHSEGRPVIQRKILAKKSRHLREASHDFGASKQLYLPPMIATPKERIEKQQTVSNQASQLPITPVINQQPPTTQSSQIFARFSNVQLQGTTNAGLASINSNRTRQGNQFAGQKQNLATQKIQQRHEKTSSQQFNPQPMFQQPTEPQQITNRTFSPRQNKVVLSKTIRRDSVNRKRSPEHQATSPVPNIAPPQQPSHSIPDDLSLNQPPIGNNGHQIQYVEVQTLLFGEAPPVLSPKGVILKNHEPTKASNKKCGIVKSYAANTNQGIIREYNEDRVSIILNIMKPKNKQQLEINWPQICFYGVFDGHGGSVCADYLRDNLHNFVIQNEKFPFDPKLALLQGFKSCENSFLNLVENAFQRSQQLYDPSQVGPERSGSCACTCLIINDQIYISNVGDSRALMSMDAGIQIASLSRDHKPEDEQEKNRIQLGGGRIYRTQTFARAAQSPNEKDLYVQGPLRVFPGRLSVSRTFGDIEAKRIRFGGNPNVIVCEPEVINYQMQDNFDFVLIGCDGIFDRLSNREVVNQVWETAVDICNVNKMNYASSPKHVFSDSKQKKADETARARKLFKDKICHFIIAEAVENVLKLSAASRSLDNITVLILGLKNFKRVVKQLLEGLTLQQIREKLSIESKAKKAFDKDLEFFQVSEEELTVFPNNKGPSQTSGSPVKVLSQSPIDKAGV